ncbi:Myotubularin protein, partial [Globisporangium splendens]
MELSKAPEARQPVKISRRSSIAVVGDNSSAAPSSPLAASGAGTNDEYEEERGSLPRRPSRLSMSLSTSSKNNSSKPWFSGHLRAMHVGDRLPRKKTRTETELDGDAESERETRRTRVARSVGLTSTMALPPRQPVEIRDVAVSTDDDNDRNEDENDGDDSSVVEDVNDDEDIFQMEPVLTSIVKPVPDETSGRMKRGAENVSITNHVRKKASRKSKLSRSASFDFTNLKSTSPSAASAHGGSDSYSLSVEASELRSQQKSSLPRQKCFDDSDIVDSRAKEDTAGENRTTNIDHATVVRFAVYKMDEKEGQGLMRTLGFGKANPVLDRYTLELDCSQGIVRVKSVFMHRYWSFHCDAVQQLTFGSSPGVARLVVRNGGQGNQTHELKFANDEEREEFKRAVDTCRSTNMRAMRKPSIATSLSSSPQLDPSCLLESPIIGPDSTSSPLVAPHQEELPDSPRAVDCEVEAVQEAACSLQLLFGEVVVKGTEFPATLLIGPAGDNYESSQVWGRIRGVVAVTNFRVLFVPSEQGYIPFRTALQGAVPYIPIFAITTVQVQYPNGRRAKSRTYSTGLPSILSISCKDVRIMRIQVDGPLAVSDERSQFLQSVISKLSDESQRYKTVKRESPPAMALTSSSPPTYLSLDHSNGNESADDGSEMNSAVIGSEDSYVGLSDVTALSVNTRSANSRKSFGSITAPSPVLQPSSPVSPTVELSGSFAFSYAVECPSAEYDGWNLFADEREFKRQVGGDPLAQPFLKFYQNARGNICKTYPSKLLLPSSMNSATLTKVADFRSKRRLPVITYYHRRNRCVLTRSSQPLLGNLITGTSSISDQLLLGVYRRLPDIIKNQSHSSVSSRPIYIFDARKLKASTGNRLMGKGGVETPQDYPGAVVHHLNIANMYRMQSSFLALVKLLLPGSVDENEKTWLSSVESTRWLNHLRGVLDGALKIARVMELEGSSVLVHCSDGWDRTAQLTALAQIMIDPYFRTIRGFAVLVEKDWCAFGHKFAERLGGDRNRDSQRNKSSPVMLQFLDAVWQMQRQFPYAFEFNERFLLHVANSLTSGLYGTFQYDSRLQRDLNDVRTNSVSVWTPVLLNEGVFRNPEYVQWDKPIWPWTGIQIMRIWEGYFLQWHPKYYNCHWVFNLNNGPQSHQVNAQPAASIANQKINFVPPQPIRTVVTNERSQAQDAAFFSPDRHDKSEQSGSTPLMSPALSSQEAPSSSHSNPSSVRSSNGSTSRHHHSATKAITMRNVFIYRS